MPRIAKCLLCGASISYNYSAPNVYCGKCLKLEALDEIEVELFRMMAGINEQ